MPGLVLVLLLVINGCRSMEPASFAGERPLFEPEKFFEGRVQSWGVIENRAGNPTSRFRVDVKGRRETTGLIITQHFFFQDGRRQQRTWLLRRIDGHRYEATSEDVVGLARGEAHGNAFRWEYSLSLKRGNPLMNVRMKHWMYLQNDGQTMINRVTITKLGIVVARITEQFRRDSPLGSSLDKPLVGTRGARPQP